MRCYPMILRAGLVAGLLLALGLVVGSVPASAQTILRVEEDWEMQVKLPDKPTNAPQITCALSPTADLSGLHALFELNDRTMNTYLPGGLQLQVWHGTIPLIERNFPSEALMETEDETVTWTQSMSLAGGVLTFEIIGGSSTTWGPFGGEGNLKALLITTLGDLNGYNPAVSVANSRIGYAANRVRSLVLKRVRVTTSTGQVLEDGTERVVYRQE